LITRRSPIEPQVPSSLTAVPLKPSGKTITEHRTVRRIGHDGEIISSVNTFNQRSTSINRDAPLNTGAMTSHESLMESIRRFGGSQNLAKT
jgi:hypothetical protein